MSRDRSDVGLERSRSRMWTCTNIMHNTTDIICVNNSVADHVSMSVHTCTGKPCDAESSTDTWTGKPCMYGLNSMGANTECCRTPFICLWCCVLQTMLWIYRSTAAIMANICTWTSDVSAVWSYQERHQRCWPWRSAQLPQVTLLSLNSLLSPLPATTSSRNSLVYE